MIVMITKKNTEIILSNELQNFRLEAKQIFETSSCSQDHAWSLEA